MWKSVLLASVWASAVVALPGKLAVWTAGSKPTLSPQYDTRSLELGAAGKIVNEVVRYSEVVVILSHAGKQFPEMVRASMKHASKISVFPNVYHTTESQAAGKTLEQAVLGTVALHGAKKDTVQLFDDAKIRSDKKRDVFIVTLKGDSSDAEVMSRLNALDSVTYIAVEEPSSVVPNQKANYNRILVDNEPAPAITEADLYLPEGTEFTIYYAGQYLYLAPELFTGLMTMLFVFFVGLIGYSCLNAIQGPACYPTKLPALGKEG